MKTDELIADLSTTLAPVPRHWVWLRLAQGAGAGALVSFVVLWAWLGFRPDLGHAVDTSMYWMKFFYTLSLALFAFWATERLARPARHGEPAGLRGRCATVPRPTRVECKPLEPAGDSHDLELC